MREIQVEETGTKYRRGQPIEAEKAEGAGWGTAEWQEKISGRGSGVERKVEGRIVKYRLCLSGLGLCLQRITPLRDGCVFLCRQMVTYAAYAFAPMLLGFTQSLHRGFNWIQLRVNFIRLAARKSVYCGLFSLCYPPFLLILLLV